MWRKHEGSDIISLKPVRRASWELQTKPGQLEQKDYNKEQNPLSPTGNTPDSFKKILLGSMSFFILRTPPYSLLLD